eukprot:TRINITY_DN12305_c0_g4_i4.p1 TRINITY_DN12305_c0_g4~~TRINITY_DN12305_c0_g4_i4.p1  ORF type:complete len:532 (+),score=193.17 TRINITY_DN12305_c0_g4_i4:120-1715(+)
MSDTETPPEVPAEETKEAEQPEAEAPAAEPEAAATEEVDLNDDDDEPTPAPAAAEEEESKQAEEPATDPLSTQEAEPEPVTETNDEPKPEEKEETKEEPTTPAAADADNEDNGEDDDDDDDIFDKPAKKPVKKALPAGNAPPPAAAAAAAGRKPSSSSEEPVEKGSLEISVSEPQRVGDGMSSYIVYKVHTKTTLPGFSQPDIEVQHRYSDFHALYKNMVDSMPGVLIPPPPPKDAMNTNVMKFKSSSDPLTPFIERRKAGLERFLQHCAAHPTIRKNETFKSFLQTETKVAKVKGAGLANMMAKLAGYNEGDEWFADKGGELDALEGQLKKLHTALETMVKRRKELAGHTTFFAESFAALADSEEIDSLKNAMHQMADVEAKVARLHSKQEHRDFYDMSEIIHDFMSMCQGMKICFQQRVNAHRAWQNAESNLVKKRDVEAKYTAANRADKLDQAAQDVTDAEEAVKSTKAQFEAISERIKKEWKRFDIARGNEIKAVLLEYVESMMTLQHQVVKAWEAFLPEAKAIGQN